MITDEIAGERGMLDLDNWDRHNGIARCCAKDCGWEGSPVYIGGVAQTWCPKCEGWDIEFGSEPDLREHSLCYPVHLPIRAPRRPQMPKQGRNEPCACGSGIKWKKCHGA